MGERKREEERERGRKDKIETERQGNTRGLPCGPRDGIPNMNPGTVISGPKV